MVINGIRIMEIKISDHYEGKHKGVITDEVIIKLIGTLNFKSFEPDAVEGKFSYFVNDHIELEGKTYKLIWLLEGQCAYVGAVNAYRRK